MKKTVTGIFAIFFIFSSILVANAAKNNTYFLEFDKAEGVESRGIAAGYDEDNRLVAAGLCDVVIGNQSCSTEVEMTSGYAGENIRIYFPNTKTIIQSFNTIERIEDDALVTDPEKEPESGKDPEKEPEQKPETDPEEESVGSSRYPTVYDAVTAFMAVKDVAMVSEDNALKTKLTVFYQGVEMLLALEDDIILESAPTAHSALTQGALSELKAGDIIFCTANLSGKIRKVELVFRPFSSDLIMQDIDYGQNFEDLFSIDGAVTVANAIPIAVYGSNNSQKQQYGFGLIKEKKERYMTLCNKEGLAEEDIDIILTPDTVVYVYDSYKAKNKIKIGTIADIEKSEIDKPLMDQDGNVLEWSGENIHHYALVRMANGVALDVALYLNYNR